MPGSGDPKLCASGCSAGSGSRWGPTPWRRARGGSGRPQPLVKLLALAPGHHLHRERAMDLLWPDQGRRAAANNLSQALHAARRALGPDDAQAASSYLASQGEQLVLCPGGELWVDVEAFEEAAATARRSRDTAAYRAALNLYAGELLPRDPYEEWAEVPREGLRQLFLSLLVELAEPPRGARGVRSRH